MDKRLFAGSLGLLLLFVAGGGWFAWRQYQPPARMAAPAPAAPPAAAPAAPATAAAPPIRHPIATLPSLDGGQAPPDPSAAPGFAAGVQDLIGKRTALTLLQGDDLIGRIVATVDNLGRERATTRLWPVIPAGGRFTTQRAGALELIAPANAARHHAFVRLVESIDTAAAVALYVRFYPQFQQSYAALGYPRAYFNDRLVDVIDQLLAAPVPAGPVAVRLIEVKGPAASARPWTQYEFADPAYEALPAGQKLLLRMGPDNALRLKSKLAEFRRALVHSIAGR